MSKSIQFEDFDFTTVLESVGQTFVSGLKKRIEDQVGIDGRAYSRPALSTLQQRSASLSKFTPSIGKPKKRKGALKNVSLDRLFVTHQLANQGFDYEASRESVSVFASPIVHNVIGNKKSITMKEIVEYNSKNQSRINPRIQDPPLVFPTSSEEVNLLQHELQISRSLFEDELNRQIKEITINTFHIDLSII